MAGRGPFFSSCRLHIPVIFLHPHIQHFYHLWLFPCTWVTKIHELYPIQLVKYIKSSCCEDLFHCLKISYVRTWKIIKGKNKCIKRLLCSVTQSCLTLCSHMDCKAHYALLPMEFPRQEYWSRLPCPPPEDLPDPGIERTSPTSPALAGRFFTTGATWEACKKKKKRMETQVYVISISDIVLGKIA